MRQTNLAYDLDLFEAHEKQEQPLLSKTVQVQNKTRHRMLKLHIVSLALVMVISISVTLFSRAQLTELTDKIGDMTLAYQSLLGENTRLKAELESKVSLRGVEERAQALGLSKVRADQVKYVNMDEEETVTLTGEWKEPSISEKLSLYIRSVLEYMTVR